MPREASLKEKNLLPKGANSFALGDDSQKGGKNENGRITSPESISIHLTQCTIYSTNSSFQSNSVNIILLLFSFKHLTEVYVSNTEYHLIFNVSSTDHLAISWGFFPLQNDPRNIYSSFGTVLNRKYQSSSRITQGWFTHLQSF